MPTIYWKNKCSKCDQKWVYGWVTKGKLFECCACHDQYDTEDTRVYVEKTTNVPEKLIMEKTY